MLITIHLPQSPRALQTASQPTRSLVARVTVHTSSSRHDGGNHTHAWSEAVCSRVLRWFIDHDHGSQQGYPHVLQVSESTHRSVFEALALGRATRPAIPPLLLLSLPFDVVFAINHLSSSIVRDAIHQPSRLPCCRTACVLASLGCVALCISTGISHYSSLNSRSLHSHHPFSHTRLCSLRCWRRVRP